MKQRVFYEPRERAATFEATQKETRVHDLRHTSASWMIQGRHSLPVVQEHLGHESIQATVGVYGHVDRAAMNRAAVAIDAAIGKPPPPTKV